MAMNHEQLRTALVAHMEAERETHSALMTELAAHAKEDTSQEHDELLGALQRHADQQEGEHRQLREMLDAHIAETV